MREALLTSLTTILILLTLVVVVVIIKMIIDFVRIRRDNHEEENLEAQESFRSWQKLNDKDDDCV